MKKLTVLLLSGIILLCSCAEIAPSAEVHDDYIYVNPTEKPAWTHEAWATFAEPPSMSLSLRFSDVVIDGTITDSKYEDFKMNPTPEEIEWGYAETLGIKVYTVKVNEVIRGELKEHEICITILHNPFDEIDEEYWHGKNVVLFLSQHVRGHYRSISGGHSIFSYDEKDRLYSYSYTEEMSAFDGKDKSELFELTRESEEFGTKKFSWQD